MVERHVSQADAGGRLSVESLEDQLTKFGLKWHVNPIVIFPNIRQSCIDFLLGHTCSPPIEESSFSAGETFPF